MFTSSQVHKLSCFHVYFSLLSLRAQGRSETSFSSGSQAARSLHKRLTVACISLCTCTKGEIAERKRRFLKLAYYANTKYSVHDLNSRPRGLPWTLTRSVSVS